MKLKKIMLLFVLFAVLFSSPAFAQNTEDILSEETDELISALPDESKDILLDENGKFSVESLSQINVSEVLGRVWEEFKNDLAAPVRSLLSVIAVIIICSVAESLKNGKASSNSNVFALVADLSIVLILLLPLFDLIERVANIIVVAGEFIFAFIPIFAGIMLACGETSKAAGYQITALSAAECVTAIAQRFIMPALSVCTALSVSSAVSDDSLKLNKISEWLKKISIAALTVLSTVYCGVITVQELAGNAADTALSKTAKFLISSSVPAIGTALGGALGTVENGMKAVKSCVGIAGIVAPIMILLPTVLGVLGWQISLKVSAAAAELFSIKKIPELLNSLSSVLGLLMSVLILLGAILIVTASVVMTIGGV